MSSPTQSRRALVSVSDKTGLAELAEGLAKLGFQMVSTGGTRRFLEERGIPVTDITQVTGFPEVMGGRVKTLHPNVHGGILARPELPEDAQALAEHGIALFDLVICNLYPFRETIAKPNVTVPEAVEQIDIGGPSMIRSAAKNHARVAVVTDASQYGRVLEELNAGELSAAFLRELAAAAFETTAQYDRAISDYFAERVVTQGESPSTESPVTTEYPRRLHLSFLKEADLRYGENPHQRAAFYRENDPPATSLAAARQLHGKELSYNNLLDLDAALNIAREFTKPAAVVLKHNNPCGCGTADQLVDAFDRAYSGDPVSAFGSIMGFNRLVDLATAERLCEPNRFVEAIIAPGFSDEAFEALTTRPKWKQNVRLLECPGMVGPTASSLDYRRVSGGLLVQDRDVLTDPMENWKVVTQREPTAAERDELHFAWLVCKHVKSNAIVFAKDYAVVGVGAGQMSRLDSAFIATHKAEGRAKGGVAASDAFFPFRDGIDLLAQAGVEVVIQPGGSRRDEEVIAACNEHGIAMVFTGNRHFRH